MVDIEAKINNHYKHSEELFADYVKQSHKAVMESLKSEVLVTVLTLLERDFHDKNEQADSLELVKQLLKKSWN